MFYKKTKTSKLSYDLDKICEFIFKNDDVRDNEVSEDYQMDENGDFFMAGKHINEVKNNIDSALSNIRYDLIKGLMEKLNGMKVGDKKYTLGETMILNTMVEKGFIKELT